jgi:Tol biopolymer transport system component
LVTTAIIDPSQLLNFSELTILDTETGNLYTLSPAPDISPGQGERYVGDIAWSPDSRHLAIWGYVYVRQVGLEGQGIYLIDAASSKYQRLFPDLEFRGGTSLFWSPDGSQLVMSCPTTGLCLVTVEAKK